MEKFPIEISERIIKVRKINKLTQKEFSRKLGISRGHLIGIEKGKRFLSRNLFLDICFKFNIEERWLASGEGPMEKKQAHRTLEEFAREAGEDILKELQLLRSKATLYDEKRGVFDEPYIYVARPPEEIPKDYEHEFAAVRLLADRAAASDIARIHEKDIEGYVVIQRSELKYEPKFYTCIRVRDSSMTPMLKEGFIVCISHKEKDPKKLINKLVAVYIEREVTIKRLIRSGKDYILTPENPSAEHPPKIFNPDKDRILGRVTWWWGEEP